MDKNISETKYYIIILKFALNILEYLKMQKCKKKKKKHNNNNTFK